MLDALMTFAGHQFRPRVPESLVYWIYQAFTPLINYIDD